MRLLGPVGALLGPDLDGAELVERQDHEIPVPVIEAFRGDGAGGGAGQAPLRCLQAGCHALVPYAG